MFEKTEVSLDERWPISAGFRFVLQGLPLLVLGADRWASHRGPLRSPDLHASDRNPSGGITGGHDL